MMTIKDLTLSLVGLALAALFILRDAVAQNCGSYAQGCIAAANVPCSNKGNCNLGSPPDGSNCIGVAANAWSATDPPATWTNCIGRTGQGQC